MREWRQEEQAKHQRVFPIHFPFHSSSSDLWYRYLMVFGYQGLRPSVGQTIQHPRQLVRKKWTEGTRQIWSICLNEAENYWVNCFQFIGWDQLEMWDHSNFLGERGLVCNVHFWRTVKKKKENGGFIVYWKCTIISIYYQLLFITTIVYNILPPYHLLWILFLVRKLLARGIWSFFLFSLFSYRFFSRYRVKLHNYRLCLSLWFWKFNLANGERGVWSPFTLVMLLSLLPCRSL